MDPRPLEIKWYKRYGKYKERIVKDAYGKDYVIGDYSWNKRNPKKKEFIEDRIPYYPNVKV